MLIQKFCLIWTDELAFYRLNHQSQMWTTRGNLQKTFNGFSKHGQCDI